jgi:SSS family solute:Na+ symporter
VYFNWVDYSVFFGYFLLVLGIGLWASFRNKSTEGYFLAGRKMGWIAIGASLFASNISSEHFIGLAGAGASTGLAVGHFELWASIILLMLAWIFVPFYLSSGVFTMPEFIQRRFDSRSRTYLATVSVIGYILTKISVTLYAGGIVLQEVMGWDMVTSAVILVLVTGVYTVLGGLMAVIYTELIQTVILIAGAVTLTVMGLYEVGGWSGLTASVDTEFFSMWKEIGHSDFPWTGIIFGAPILGIWYWCTDQFIVQRVLSARNIPIAQRGAIFAGFLKILPIFILVLPGIIAHALNPEIQGDAAYPWLVTTLLPIGVRGIVIASLLAALMSSLASVFNSASTLITFDSYKKVRPEASESQLLRVGYIATVVLVILGIAWVPFIKHISSSVYIYLQSVQAYVSPPIAVIFLLGVFWPKTSPRASFVALMTGLALGALRFIGELFKWGTDSSAYGWFFTMNFLHFAVFLFIVAGVIAVIISLIDNFKPTPQVQELTWAGAKDVRSKIKLEGSYKVNVILSGLLVLSILALWIIFM